MADQMALPAEADPAVVGPAHALNQNLAAVAPQTAAALAEVVDPGPAVAPQTAAALAQVVDPGPPPLALAAMGLAPAAVAGEMFAERFAWFSERWAVAPSPAPVFARFL